MIIVGDRSGDDYDVLGIVRAIVGVVSGAYVKSARTAEDYASSRVSAMLSAGLFDGVQMIADSEREKIRRWGGYVVEVRLRGDEDALLAFIGARHIMIKGDGKVVPGESMRRMAAAITDLGYPEVRLQ